MCMPCGLHLDNCLAVPSCLVYSHLLLVLFALLFPQPSSQFLHFYFIFYFFKSFFFQGKNTLDKAVVSKLGIIVSVRPLNLACWLLYCFVSFLHGSSIFIQLQQWKWKLILNAVPETDCCNWGTDAHVSSVAQQLFTQAVYETVMVQKCGCACLFPGYFLMRESKQWHFCRSQRERYKAKMYQSKLRFGIISNLCRDYSAIDGLELWIVIL